ncbi:MAG: PilN domain-containing protein [Microgenomates group bacterium]
MKLPAFFGHKKSINLLPRDSFENSTMGVVLEWALVFGKWAVILTQLVVMGTFLYRFTLDRQLTDLRKSITKQVAIIKSYDQIERDYVLSQKQLAKAKDAIESQNLTINTLSELAKITPADVWFEKIGLTKESLGLTAYSSSLTGFGQFLTTIQKDPMFRNINLAKLETSSAKGAQIQFEINSTIGNKK